MIATGTYGVLFGDRTDDYGDDQDTTLVVGDMSALVGSVIEQSQDVRRRVDGASRSVRRFTGRFPGVWAGRITEEHRLRENQTGRVFVVEQVREQANPFTGSQVVLRLVLVT